MHTRDKHKQNLRDALTRRGLPADIGAAMRRCHDLPRDDRALELRAVRDAQREAHRLTCAEYA